MNNPHLEAKPTFLKKLKSIINGQLFFPSLVLYYGIVYILFGEKYYMNDGFSMDGMVFSTFVKIFNVSYFFDTYYVHRIFPSYLIGGIFKLLSINVSNSNHLIFIAFQVLNLFSIIVSCFYIKKILILLKVSNRNQLLALTLFVFNFAVLRMPLYLAVMTDSVAMVLSIAMLYYYIKKNMFGLVVCTLLSCFTWQMLFFQGLILVAIPFSTISYTKVKPYIRHGIPLLAALLATSLCVYLVYIQHEDTNVVLVAKTNKTLLPLSVLGIGMLFYFFTFILLNAKLLDVVSFFKKLKPLNIGIAILLLGSTIAIIHYLNPPASKFYPLYNMLTGTITSSLMWPLHTIVSHTSFWGMAMLLLIIFWTDFSKLISQMGWGIVLALSLNIFTFGIISETRCLANLLPWIIVFLAKAINKYSFSNAFYIVVGVLSVFMSKIWMLLNPSPTEPYNMQLDKNGSMGFPDQKLWMHVGPWMSEQMYYIQAAGILVILLLLFFILYKIGFNEKRKLQLTARYKR